MIKYITSITLNHFVGVVLHTIKDDLDEMPTLMSINETRRETDNSMQEIPAENQSVQVSGGLCDGTLAQPTGMFLKCHE